MTPPVISPELVLLDADLGNSPEQVVAALATCIHHAGRAQDAHQLAFDACAREKKSPTGVPGQVAIPHCRSTVVEHPTVACARLSTPVDFSGPDGPATLVFLIAAPADGGKQHLAILSSLARALVRPEFLQQLRSSCTPEEIVAAVEAALAAKKIKKNTNPTPNTTATPSVLQRSVDSEQGGVTPAAVTHIVAITACPTGIAHTYMAADALTQAAAAREDVELHVETQGSSSVTPLPEDIVRCADAVIFATDVGVKDKERFVGKPTIASGVKRAINEPMRMIDEAVDAAKNGASGDRNTSQNSVNTALSNNVSTSSVRWPQRIQQAVMTGVSYMLPFVAAGGLLLALGFLIGGADVANGWTAIATDYSLGNLPGHTVMVDGAAVEFSRSGILLYLGALFFATGQMSMQFIVAALSGYIAYALAGRPGIAPGFVGGAVSVLVGAGFIGGLVTGILAGLVVMVLSSWKVPRVVAALMPVVIIPLCASAVVGLVMFLILGRPLAAALTGMQQWLSGMSGSSAALLGIIIGLMMCFDLGGPVNKAAYLFATAGLSTGDEASTTIMAAVMAAGMVPPIGLSVATFLRSSLFSETEKENGRSAWLLGLSFISEGAIPFAAADPFRTIPAMMAGGAVTGALSMSLGVATRSPHGGIFVLPFIAPQWGFIVALLAGVLTTAGLVIILKHFTRAQAS